MWGDAALTSFDGSIGALSLDGDVLTATLGVDRSFGSRWLTGLAVSYSDGDGSYGPNSGGGSLRSTMISLVPYIRFRASDRIWFWGALARGVGDMRLEPRAGSVLETELDHALAAVGGRARLARMGGSSSALELALRSDLLWSRSSSDAAAGLREATGSIHRSRVMLEGTVEFPFLGGRLRPSVEGGLRNDGGDAETGFSYELGYGLGWNIRGVTIDATGRTQLIFAGQDLHYEESGYSLSILLGSGGGNPGPHLSVGSTWGAAQSGLETVWTEPAWANAGVALPLAQRYRTEFGYGFGGERHWYPFVAMDAQAADTRAVRLGLKLQLNRQMGLRLEAGRRETAFRPGEDAVMLEIQGQF